VAATSLRPARVDTGRDVADMSLLFGQLVRRLEIAGPAAGQMLRTEGEGQRAVGHGGFAGHAPQMIDSRQTPIESVRCNPYRGSPGNENSAPPHEVGDDQYSDHKASAVARPKHENVSVMIGHPCRRAIIA